MLSTPSAHRVSVDSSPLSSSPLQFLSTMLARENAETRSHPNAERDVWEIAVWDPAPMSLQMFCLFSPGHVLVYWLFLPTVVSDPRPSTTFVTTVLLTSVLSVQLLLLQGSFSRQSQNAAVVHKEVMNEYDTKYVHPRTQPLMRDVGIQCSDLGSSRHGLPQGQDENNSVDLYAPTHVINRDFQTRPNPNYIKHVNPQAYAERAMPSRAPSVNMISPFQTPAHLRDISSPIHPKTVIRQPQYRVSGGGDGGNFGVYSHANSPLRKSMSTNFTGSQRVRERNSSPQKRGSPLKRNSLAPAPNGQLWDSSQRMPGRKEGGGF